MAVIPTDQRGWVTEGLQEIMIQARMVKELFGSELLSLEFESIKNLDRDLWKELNRTHDDNGQSGELSYSRDWDQWRLMTTPQPRKLSWRRSGRGTKNNN